jgi:hypothetical protein
MACHVCSIIRTDGTRPRTCCTSSTRHPLASRIVRILTVRVDLRMHASIYVSMYLSRLVYLCINCFLLMRSNWDLFISNSNLPTGKDSDCEWSDESQAVLSYVFLVKFFTLYAEYSTNPFYMSGESYAGVLVPTLAIDILAARTDANKKQAPWNVQGIMLGNAVPGSRILTATPYSGWLGARVAVDFRYGHGMISVRIHNT